MSSKICHSASQIAHNSMWSVCHITIETQINQQINKPNTRNSEGKTENGIQTEVKTSSFRLNYTVGMAMLIVCTPFSFGQFCALYVSNIYSLRLIIYAINQILQCKYKHNIYIFILFLLPPFLCLHGSWVYIERILNSWLSCTKCIESNKYFDDGNWNIIIVQRPSTISLSISLNLSRPLAFYLCLIFLFCQHAFGHY